MKHATIEMVVMHLASRCVGRLKLSSPQHQVDFSSPSLRGDGDGFSATVARWVRFEYDGLSGSLCGLRGLFAAPEGAPEGAEEGIDSALPS